MSDRRHCPQAEQGAMRSRLVLRPVMTLGGRVLLPASRSLSALSRLLSRLAHCLQLVLERGFVPGRDWFDHHVDVNWNWPKTRNPMFLERGVFNCFAIEPGARVLELSCGDGFNTRYFYSLKAEHVVAVDADPAALRFARRVNRARNIEFRQCDIRYGLPEGQFDNVVWDAGLEYLSDDEALPLIERVRTRLRPGGVFSGHTVRTGEGDQHLYRQLNTREDLAARLRTAFPHAVVLETVYPTRTNYYFYASDEKAALPFLGSSRRLDYFRDPRLGSDQGDKLADGDGP